MGLNEYVRLILHVFFFNAATIKFKVMSVACIMLVRWHCCGSSFLCAFPSLLLPHVRFLAFT